jgi:nucleotide-binding universal stress UspA family protein
MSAQTAEHTIVVGVDGSGPSREALSWACRQAKLTGAAVRAVIAWHYPDSYGYPIPVNDVDWPGLARQVVTDAIADLPDQGSVTCLVVQGDPAQVLLDASSQADLLVVGSRGHGGFLEALLGSVGQHCVHHATCPVVVIRGARS